MRHFVGDGMVPLLFRPDGIQFVIVKDDDVVAEVRTAGILTSRPSAISSTTLPLGNRTPVNCSAAFADCSSSSMVLAALSA